MSVNGSPDDLLVRAEEFEKRANKMKRRGDRSAEQHLRGKAEKFLREAVSASG